VWAFGRFEAMPEVQFSPHREIITSIWKPSTTMLEEGTERKYYL
jgi:hypothetical protein